MQNGSFVGFERDKIRVGRSVGRSEKTVVARSIDGYIALSSASVRLSTAFAERLDEATFRKQLLSRSLFI